MRGSRVARRTQLLRQKQWWNATPASHATVAQQTFRHQWQLQGGDNAPVGKRPHYGDQVRNNLENLIIPKWCSSHLARSRLMRICYLEAKEQGLQHMDQSSASPNSLQSKETREKTSRWRVRKPPGMMCAILKDTSSIYCPTSHPAEPRW